MIITGYLVYLEMLIPGKFESRDPI